METIAKIRRDHFRDGKNIKAIARTRGLSRNTVRKVLRSEETAFRYARQAPTVYPKLGAFQAQLEEFLTARLGQPRRERLTLMRMCELLREAGYTGGYDAVRRYARWWRRAHGQADVAYVPLTFEPGEAYQFDWSHEIVVLGGVTTTVKVAHLRLCHSRMPFVRAYPRETQEMVFDAHNRAFAFYRGACGRQRHQPGGDPTRLAPSARPSLSVSCDAATRKGARPPGTAQPKNAVRWVVRPRRRRARAPLS